MRSGRWKARIRRTVLGAKAFFRRQYGRMVPRQYPSLPATEAAPQRPISFIVVHYSDDYFHNFLHSQCVHDSLNQLITIDNRQNLFFDNLSQAINAGLDRARHELVAVVHEDVVLPQGWQHSLERSLAALEQVDSEWGLLGSAGWNADGKLFGHYSDPFRYVDTLGDRSFEEVRTIDEQLMILRRSRGLRFDEHQPSIHNIGRLLASTLRQRGLRTYVVNAPTIHKFADQNGTPITGPGESPKIQARALPAFAADMASCDEYLFETQPEWQTPEYSPPDWNLRSFRRDVRERLARPVVLLSRGGSGSRLLSILAGDLGIFLGNEVNESGDAMEMVEALYRAVLDQHLLRAPWQRQRIVPRLRQAAAHLLQAAVEPAAVPWGFKLPEAMLALPEIDAAFPQAKYVHLLRDPLTTCLRRSHMTARFDNTIGRLAIREGYRHSGREVARALDDPPALHMAFTTIHQVESVRRYARSDLNGRYLEIRFEEVLDSPRGVLENVGRWLGLRIVTERIVTEVDPGRAASPSVRYPPEVEAEVERILAPLRRELGYGSAAPMGAAALVD